MSLVNNATVDFGKLDIEKYLNWLNGQYELFSIAKDLPILESIYNDYLVRKSIATSHYLATRSIDLPDPIQNLYNTKINHFKSQIKELKELVLKLINFDIVKDHKYTKSKKYFYFTADELSAINIDVDTFNLCLNSFNNIWKLDFIKQLEMDFLKKPLPKETYYLQKINEIKSAKFKYLDQILNAQIVYNLDNSKVCRYFFTEVSRIWEISYLEKQITKSLKTSKHKTLGLNPNMDDLDRQIIVIYNNSKDLFVSTLEQWQNLFSDDIKVFKKSIELKKGVSKADLRLFIDTLKYYGFIRTGGFIKVLVNANAFSEKGVPLTNSQYKGANNGKNYPITRNSDKVKEVFNALRLLDK